MSICHHSKNILIISVDGDSFDVVYDVSPIVLAIGTFDGVHLGHQNLIQRAIHEANNLNGTCGVYTFAPHPSFVICRNTPKPMIVSLAKKYELLKQFDTNGIFVQKFDISFSQQSPEMFLNYLTKKFPTLRGICVGENFKFGKDRIGNVDVLTTCAKKYNISVHIVSPTLFKGERISSSRIRQSIASGNIDEATKMLGYSLQ